MLSRLLGCFRPRASPSGPRGASELAWAHHQELLQLVLYGGSLQPTEGAPILLACALLLESRELRAMDVAAVCTNLLLVAASSRLEEGVLVQVARLLVDHGGNPAAFGGAAVATAALAARPRLAAALLAACPSGCRCVGGMALLPLLQDAVCAPGFPWQAPEPASLGALRWLLPRLPPDHLAGLSVMGLPLPHAALQVLRGRVGPELATALVAAAPLAPSASNLGTYLQLCALFRAAALLEVLVGSGVPPVAAEQSEAPAGLPPEAWLLLREAATAWPAAWSRESHRRYHGTFRAAAAALLLVAHRGFFVAPPPPGCGNARRTGCAPRSGRQLAGLPAAAVLGGPQPALYHLPPPLVERVIQLAAQHQRDWVQPC